MIRSVVDGFSFRWSSLPETIENARRILENYKSRIPSSGMRWFVPRNPIENRSNISLLDQLKQKWEDIEFAEEIEFLDNLLRSNDLEQVRSSFIEKCQTRDLQNYESCFGFLARPESNSNSLYYNLFVCLFSTTTTGNLLDGLLPHTKKHLNLTSIDLISSPPEGFLSSLQDSDRFKKFPDKFLPDIFNSIQIEQADDLLSLLASFPKSYYRFFLRTFSGNYWNTLWSRLIADRQVDPANQAMLNDLREAAQDEKESVSNHFLQPNMSGYSELYQCSPTFLEEFIEIIASLSSRETIIKLLLLEGDYRSWERKKIASQPWSVFFSRHMMGQNNLFSHNCFLRFGQEGIDRIERVLQEYLSENQLIDLIKSQSEQMAHSLFTSNQSQLLFLFLRKYLSFDKIMEIFDNVLLGFIGNKIKDQALTPEKKQTIFTELFNLFKSISEQIRDDEFDLFFINVASPFLILINLITDESSFIERVLNLPFFQGKLSRCALVVNSEGNSLFHRSPKFFIAHFNVFAPHLSPEEKALVLQKQNNKGNTILHLSCTPQILAIMDAHLTEHQKRNLLYLRNSEEDTVFQLALDDPKYLESLLSMATALTLDLRRVRSKPGRVYKHHPVFPINGARWKILSQCATLEDLKNILTNPDIPGTAFQRQYSVTRSYSVRYGHDEYETKYIHETQSVEVRGNTVFHLGIQEGLDLQSFRRLIGFFTEFEVPLNDIKRVITAKNSEGSTLFHVLCDNLYIQGIPMLKELLESFLTREEIRQFLKQQDNDGNTILRIARTPSYKARTPEKTELRNFYLALADFLKEYLSPVEIGELIVRNDLQKRMSREFHDAFSTFIPLTFLEQSVRSAYNTVASFSRRALDRT